MATVLIGFGGGGTGAADPLSIQDLLQADLNEAVSGADVPGAQLVLTDGSGTLQIDSGVGDLGTGAAFPDNAQVRIASNTKSFVSAVMLQLVGEARVELDAPVERYLPGVVRGPGGDGNIVTIRNLLQHTSGIPDYILDLDLESVAALRQSRSSDDLIRLAMAKTAEFTPGDHAEYSNTNYLIAGKVIERVTGLPVGVEVTRRILLPLGLRDTYWPLYPLESVIRGPHARAYHEFDGTRTDVTDIDPGWGLPDGAMVSTGADMNRFYMALLAGRVLGAAELTEMERTVPSGDLRRSEDFGLGLFHWTTSCGIEAWGHGGTIHGTFVYGGATAGRSVTVSMNELPDIIAAKAHDIDLDGVVDAALCAPR
ncbi:serine hydrolase domain-containing protein [Nocardia sp. NPDC006630]|uniref:serine hydrolase domain-containing protein n=1 Tax=Nocardia sp. NPDC006630 TaxID=3157181 RepID=UPI0033A4C244